MREQAGQILKAICFVLAALLLYQLVQVGLRMNPLSHVVIPALPRLASDTNAPDGGKGMTNSAQVKTAKGTYTPSSDPGTNSLAVKGKKENGTNIVSGELAKLGATNSSSPLTAALAPSADAKEKGGQTTSESHNTTNTSTLTKEPEAAKPEANSPMLTVESAPVVSATNLPSGNLTNDPSSVSGTNILTVALDAGGIKAHASTGTNSSLAGALTGTNVLPALSGSNSPARAKTKSKGTNSPTPSAMAMGGMSPAQMRGGGRPAELPPEIKARVDRIYESELFGMVMRPVPMGLLGIAGNSAFLRAPSGQTGLVKEGDTLGEIKLLRIGINRVLVEQDGKKSELMIFDGYGGESLMPKENETSK